MDVRKYRTLRLTFRYEGSRVSLTDRQVADMISPPSITERPVVGKSSGFWIELQNKGGQSLFHRVLYRPIPYTVEKHLADGSMKLVADTPGEGEFEVLLPALPDAETVVLYSSPLDLKRSLEPAEEIGRFSLMDNQPTKK